MNKVRQADFGTPPVTGGETVRIEIDGLPAMDEIAELTPTFHNVSFEFLDRVGSGAVAVQRSRTDGHSDYAH